jgi:DNA 3'-phosphatase
MEFFNMKNITDIFFDLDHTLIKPKSGVVFPKDENDWTWNYDNVIEILNKLQLDGYSIVIFTNQKGLTSKKFTIQTFSKKIEPNGFIA